MEPGTVDECTGCFPEPAVSYRKKSKADLPPTPQARCEADLGLMFNSKCDITARSAVVVGAKVAVPWSLALLPLSLMDGRLGPTRPCPIWPANCTRTLAQSWGDWVMRTNSARLICTNKGSGTPPCPPYVPGCNTKIRQANFDSIIIFFPNQSLKVMVNSIKH